MTNPRARTALLAAASALALTACGSDDGEGAASADGASSSSAAPESSMDAGPTTAADQPFGAACSSVPADGEGSFLGMTDDPVATAAGNNPVLSTLVQAVQAASLVDTLNTTEDITVLAPANPAFEAVPADVLATLLADTPRLTAVLTHHVVPGRLTPDELAGTHTTLNNDEVTVEGSGEDFTLSADQTVLGTAEASVICGNVQTANATVYVIDQVLAPPAA